MAFGSDYKAEVFSNSVRLDDGNYGAKIVKTEGVEKNGNKFIRVEFVVNDNPNAWPNTYYIFDSPTKAKDAEALEKAKSMWNKKMTAFFDAFKIERGDFNFHSWVGKTGEVTIQSRWDDSTKLELVAYKTKPRERKATNPDFSSIGTVVASTPADANTDNFDSMPF